MNCNNKQTLHRYLPLVIILFGVLLRCYKIDSPIYDDNHVRQTFVATSARNFYRYDYNIFMPRMDWNYHQPGYLILEFPVISFIAGLLYAVFGIHEVIGRIVAVTFSTGSMYLFYKLCRRYFNRSTSLFSLALFAILPYSVYYERVFMTDPVMLFFSIGMIYFLLKWLDNQTRINLVIAASFGGLSFLAKAHSLIMLLPASYLILEKFGRAVIRKRQVYVYFAIMLIPIVLWFLHMRHINLQYSPGHTPFGVENWKIKGWMPGYSSIVDWWSDPKFYLRINNHLAKECLTPLGYILFLLGISLPVKERKYLFHFWLIALFVFCLLQPYGITTHTYYVLPFVTVAAAFGGKTLGFIFDCGSTTCKLVNFARKILSVVLLLVLMWWGWKVLEPAHYTVYQKPLLVAEVIKNLTNPDDLVVFSGWGTHGLSCEYLYACDRKGRQDSLEAVDQGNVSTYVKGGVRYFVVLVSRKELLTDHRTMEFGRRLLKDHLVITEGDGYMVFNLQGKG